MHSRTAASAKSLPVRLLAEPELAPGNAAAAAEAAKSAAKAVLEAALETARLHAMAREAGALRTAKSWPENDAQLVTTLYPRHRVRQQAGKDAV